MNDSAHETLKELVIGTVFFGVIVQIICLLLADNLLYVSLGLWIGIAMAVFFGIHLKRSIEDALDFDERGALKHMRKSYAFRYAMVAIAFGATIYFDIGHSLMLLVGIMGLKIGAYLQPTTHQVLEKLQKSK